MTDSGGDVGEQSIDRTTNGGEPQRGAGGGEAGEAASKAHRQLPSHEAPAHLGTETWDELRSLGRTTLALLQDVDWVQRRVETISFVGSRGFERRVTLDIDGERVRQIVRRSGGDLAAPILLPLTVLNKGLLLDVDVRDAQGKSLTVVTSDMDARAGQAALLACLDTERHSAFDVATLSPAIRKTIYNAVRCFPSDDDRKVLSHPEDATESVASWELAEDLSGDPEDVRRWAEILDQHEDFSSLLVNLTLRFMLMTPLHLADETVIIKYRYQEVQEPSQLRLRERLGFRTFTPMLVAAPVVGTATREHCRLLAPDGMCLDSVYLWDVRGGLGPGERARPAAGNERYQRRMTPERASIYTSGFKDRAQTGAFWLAFALRPKRSGFLVPAQVALFASILLLVAGAVSELLGGRLHRASGDSAAAAVAILLVLPSLVSAYFANQGEHELLSELLRLPRLGVVLASFATLLAGGSLIVGLSGTELISVWLGSAGVSTLVFVQLFVTSLRSGRAVKDVLDVAHATEEQAVLVLSG